MRKTTLTAVLRAMSHYKLTPGLLAYRTSWPTGQYLKWGCRQGDLLEESKYLVLFGGEDSDQYLGHYAITYDDLQATDWTWEY